VHYNYWVHKLSAILVIAAVVISACNIQISSVDGPTSTPFIITSTLPPTAVPSATLTPIPPTLTPTMAPTDGMTTTQVNVRDQPSTTAAQLGILAPFVKVQIVGRDAGGTWYRILYLQGQGGAAWVTAQYINVQNKDKIPVIGGAASTATLESATGTPSASGTVIQQVNVRKGPGTDFDALGTLNAKETAALTGRDASGSWLQIAYSAAPGGKGWVAAAFIQSAAAQGLPIIGDGSSTAVAAVTGVATRTPSLPSPTPAVAPPDGDSAQAPAATITFSPSGTRALLYSSDVSAPQGDAEDFVGFTTYGPVVLISLTCTGNGALKTELVSASATVTNWSGLTCGELKTVALEAGQAYVLSLSLSTVGASQAYVHYTIRIAYPG
jgi:uncharacterized protein YraI